MVITGSDGSFHYWDKVTDERITSTLELENKLNELSDENEQLKQQLDDNLQFLIRASKRLGFESLDHLLYTLDKGEITGYSTANWKNEVHE